MCMQSPRLLAVAVSYIWQVYMVRTLTAFACMRMPRTLLILEDTVVNSGLSTAVAPLKRAQPVAW